MQILNCQALTPFCPPPFQHKPPIFRAHALPESMRSFSSCSMRLICPFHFWLLLYFVKFPLYRPIFILHKQDTIEKNWFFVKLFVIQSIKSIVCGRFHFSSPSSFFPLSSFYRTELFHDSLFVCFVGCYKNFPPLLKNPLIRQHACDTFPSAGWGGCSPPMRATLGSHILTATPTWGMWKKRGRHT